MNELVLAISLLLASHGQPHGLMVSWNPVHNAQTYWLQVGRWPGRDWRIVATPHEPWHHYIEGLWPQGTCFRVKTSNPAGHSDYSAQACYR